MSELPESLEFEEIFARFSDFDLANSIAGAVEEKYGYEAIMRWDERVPLTHRAVSFIWSVAGHGECQGYVAVLWMECQHSAIPLALREIGLDDLAEIMDAMMAPVIGTGALGDLEKLESHFGGWEPFAAWVSGFQRDLFAAWDRICDAVASYCRAHQEDYRELLPELRESNAYREAFGCD